MCTNQARIFNEATLLIKCVNIAQLNYKHCDWSLQDETVVLANQNEAPILVNEG